MLRRPRFRLSRHVTERMMNKQLDILVRMDPDAGVWVSQCLQYDIAAQGASIKDSLVAFTHALVSEVVYGIEVRKLVDDPLSWHPAPPSYPVLPRRSSDCSMGLRRRSCVLPFPRCHMSLRRFMRRCLSCMNSALREG